MAEDQIAGKAAADKRTALLGLAAGTHEEAGECLSPEAMTIFLAGDCSAEERRAALRHISLCRRCYGEWLILAQMQMDSGHQRRKGEKVPFFLKPANLAALVSAMAAVVCVGLFLDINPFGHRITPQTETVAPMPKAPAPPAVLPQKPMEEKMPEEERLQPQRRRSLAEDSGRMDNAAVEKKIKGEPPPRPAATTPSTSPPAGAVSRMAASPRTEAEQTVDTAAVREAPSLEKAERKSPETVPFHQWLKEAQSVCRAEGQGASADDRRLHLFQTGKAALDRWRHDLQRSSADRDPRHLHLQELLNEAKNPEQLFAHCREILDADDMQPK